MRGQKILIVEDDSLNMELMVDILEMDRYQVIQATTAEEGIKMAKEDLPCLILMDVSLPGMGGLEATRILVQDSLTKGIPVLALSSYAMKSDEEKAFEAGCHGYMTKPFDTKSLSKKVAELVSNNSNSRR
jgi:CheY-like chemotaxis protein